jgi:hypothetical protein
MPAFACICIPEELRRMGTNQTIRWGVDVAMGITFLVTLITGLFNWTLLMRTLGLTSVVLPLALMSEIHSWAGPLLGVFVAIHLFINRAWIIATTRKILSGKIKESE